MTFTPTPYMSLPVPPIEEPGPQWAENINDCMDIIDSHNHTSGNGTQIPTAGIMINADLEFNNNNAIELQSTRYTNLDSTLAGALDKNCLYFVGGNLYINNNSGTSVQLTNGASINLSTVGTIGGDYGQPGVNASAVYSDTTKTFTWTQEPSQAAKMAFGDLSLYDSSLVGSNPVTIRVDGTVATGYDFYIPLAGPSANQVYRQNSSSTNADFVTVQGTANQVTITHGASTITSSLPASIIAPGSLTTTTTLSSTGDFAVNTNKFTVASSSGDAYSAGNLTISGNSSVGGNLTVSGDVNISGNGQGIVPLGAIIAMTSGLTGAMAIPASGVASNGWQRCDGAAIAGGSTLSGTTPNLSNSVFLMGSTTYGTTGGSNTTTLTTTQLPAHTHDIAHSHSNTFALGGTTSFATTSHTHGMDHVHQTLYSNDTRLYGPSSIAQGQVTSFTTGVSGYGVNWTTTSDSSSGIFYRANSGYTGALYSAKAVDSGGTVMTSTGTPSATGTVTLSGSVTALGTTASGSAGSGAAYDSRPSFISIIYLLRVS